MEIKNTDKYNKNKSQKHNLSILFNLNNQLTYYVKKIKTIYQLNQQNRI